MCRSTRRPLLCPNCINRGHLNDLALRTARQHKQKLLERINWALEFQVCHDTGHPLPTVPQVQQPGWNRGCLFATLMSSTTPSDISNLFVVLPAILAAGFVREASSLSLSAEKEGAAGCAAAAACRALGVPQEMFTAWCGGRNGVAKK